MTRALLLVGLPASISCAGRSAPRLDTPTAQPAAHEPEASDVDSSATPVGHCYVFARTEPPGRFSNCYTTESACREGVAKNAANFADQGGSFEVDCALSEAPFCAVALDGIGAVTFRSCAWNAEVCEEQRRRALGMIQRGMITGPEPSCRAATLQDLTRTGVRAEGAIGPMQ